MITKQAQHSPTRLQRPTSNTRDSYLLERDEGALEQVEGWYATSRSATAVAGPGTKFRRKCCLRHPPLYVGSC